MKPIYLAALALFLLPNCARAVPIILRVADAMGAPLGGVAVEVADYGDITNEKPDVGQIVKTAADGTLSLDLRGTSGRPNEFIFQLNGKNVLGFARVRDPKLGFAVTPMVAGENRLTMQPTSRVQGVVNDANGALLAGAQVTFIRAAKSEQEEFVLSAQYGLMPIVATTDAAGRWEISNLPRGYAEFSVSAPGLVKEYPNFPIDKIEITAPALKMRPAGIVRGRVLDFGGQPIPDVTVYLSDNSGAVAESDAQGRFEMPGVAIGESALEFNSSASNWTGIAAEIKVEMPAQNAIVDIGDVRADEGLLLTGKVVDDLTKAPLAGVQLKMFTNNAVLQTDAQGRFESRVQKPYYGLDVVGDYSQKRFMAGDAQNGDKYDVGTIEVERLGATFRGRVTDEKGAPIPDVRVGWNEKSQFRFITPNADGNFEIKNLPFKPLQISASDGRRLTAATATPGEPLTLPLAPATAPISDAELEKLWDELPIKRVWDLNPYFEALGNRRVFDVARRLDAGVKPEQLGEGLSDYISHRVRMARTPTERESMASNAYELVKLLDLRNFSAGLAQVAILASRTEDAELRAWAARWYDAQKLRVKPLDSPDKVEWYDIAQSEWVMQVGAALGREDAVKARDIWLAQVDKPNAKNPDYELADWGEALWLAQPKWFDEIVGSWSAPERMFALKGALRIENDPVRAKALLTRLETLIGDPAVVAADAASTDQISSISKSASVLYQARINYARAVAALDAPAALDELDKVRAIVDASDVYAIAADIARAAIADNKSELARRALNLGLRESYNGGSGAPAMALIARDFDADLSAQLLEVGRKSDVASYAIALREFDAGAGRLLIEDQWAKRGQTPDETRPERDHEKQVRINAQEKLAWAMAFYDVARALQWLSEIKDDRNEWNNGIERTRLAIMVAALVPPERRAFLLGATYFG